jgi:hypothetical protein
MRIPLYVGIASIAADTKSVNTSDSSGLLLTDNFVIKTEEIICIKKVKIMYYN